MKLETISCFFVKHCQVLTLPINRKWSRTWLFNYLCDSTHYTEVKHVHVNSSFKYSQSNIGELQPVCRRIPFWDLCCSRGL